VQIGVIGSGGSQHISTISTTSSLDGSRVLPALTTPTVAQDANGGASFDATLPSGVSEALVEIIDFGPGGRPAIAPGTSSSCSSSFGNCVPIVQPNCQGPKGAGFAPVYYTVVVRHSGSYLLGAAHGPNTNENGGASHLVPSPSLCTAAQNKKAVGTNAPDSFTVQMIGFDYPAYEAALSLTQRTVPQTPKIAGPGGQSDITLSIPVLQNCIGCSVPRAPGAIRRAPSPSRPAFIPRFSGTPD